MPAAAVLAVSLGTACDVMPLTAPSGTAITLLAAPTALSANGTAQVTAILIEGAQGAPGQDGTAGEPINGVGTPVHNGTVVNFVTSLGRIEPAEATTTNGRATVVLYGNGQTGTATVTAFSGGSSQTLEVTIGDVGAAGSGG